MKRYYATTDNNDAPFMDEHPEGEFVRYEDVQAVMDGRPILSQYHGRNGFELERFVKDYEAWSAEVWRDG